MTEPNMQGLDYQIATMTAAKNGAKIESRYRCGVPGGDWYADPIPVWDWVRLEYRVVPEPQVYYALEGVRKMFFRRAEAVQYRRSWERAGYKPPRIMELVEKEPQK